MVELITIEPMGRIRVLSSYHFFMLLMFLGMDWVISPLLLKCTPTICASAFGILKERMMGPDLIILVSRESCSGIYSCSAMMIKLGCCSQSCLQSLTRKGLGSVACIGDPQKPAILVGIMISPSKICLSA